MHGNRKDLARRPDSIHDYGLARLMILARERVDTTRPHPTNAARDAVVHAVLVDADRVGAGLSRATMVASRDGAGCRVSSRRSVKILLPNSGCPRSNVSRL